MSVDEVLEIAASTFGVLATGGEDLGSERDQTFALHGANGDAVVVLKVSNSLENPTVLDMEALAALHVIAVDAGLNVAVPWRCIESGRPGPAAPGDDPAALRAFWSAGPGGHWIRAYDLLPGATRIDATTLDDAALVAWGETTARLARALRSFTHASAGRTMLWDVQHALAARPMLDDVRDPKVRSMIARVLDQYEKTATKAWPRLRAQIVHGDLTVDNTLTDGAGLITGIVDFGDMSYSALVTDIASVLDSVTGWREGSDLFRCARLVIDGYQSRTELEEIELAHLGELWAARCALTIVISSWRVARGLEKLEFAERHNGAAVDTLKTMEAIGWPEVARQLGAVGLGSESGSLAARRAEVFGPAIEPLSYDIPLAMVNARNVWLTDTEGRVFLDAYNNVPCVGHGHPRVTAAVSRQLRRLNTHMRYLHPAAIELAERLVATCPPELDTVFLVNSGSEANDLAWRMATAITGRRGGLCTAFAYHGITEAVAALSPETWLNGPRPNHVETWEPPDAYRSLHLGTDGFASALARAVARGVAPAAVILDGLLISDGIADLDPRYVQELVQLTRDAGALWIDDEVQAGHGRTGEALWCFQRFGIVPDFVTLGKAMGNGYPVAAVVTRRDIAAALVGTTVLFSTFGGNPVSAVAGLAVLDVIDDERVLERVRRAGTALRTDVTELVGAMPGVGDVRGVGLALGVELVTDHESCAPDGPRARAVRDRMRHLGVLVGTTGRHGNVLKVRPPLAFTVAHVPIVMEALATALEDTAPH